MILQCPFGGKIYAVLINVHVVVAIDSHFNSSYASDTIFSLRFTGLVFQNYSWVLWILVGFLRNVLTLLEVV